MGCWVRFSSRRLSHLIDSFHSPSRTVLQAHTVIQNSSITIQLNDPDPFHPRPACTQSDLEPTHPRGWTSITGRQWRWRHSTSWATWDLRRFRWGSLRWESPCRMFSSHRVRYRLYYIFTIYTIYRLNYSGSMQIGTVPWYNNVSYLEQYKVVNSVWCCNIKW